MHPSLKQLVLAAGLAAAGTIQAAELSIEIHAIDANGTGASLGTLTAADSPFGLLLTPDLKGLEAGLHGFHVHQNPDCGPAEKDGQKVAGLAAGGHYDPKQTGAHLGPYDLKGHLGDLPALYVAADGTATLPVLAPRLKIKDLEGRSVMIHGGGDNYSDQPKPLGGGGPRVACGVVK